MGLHEKAGSRAVRLADGGRRRKLEGKDEPKRADAAPLRGGFGGDETAGVVAEGVSGTPFGWFGAQKYRGNHRCYYIMIVNILS